MKYHVKCLDCGNECDLELNFEPKRCLSCGGNLEVEVVKSKARLTAEAKFAEMDEIYPRMVAAREAYWDVLVEYNDRLQFLGNYHRRGIITTEEYNSYKLKSKDFPKDMNKALSDYRKGKRFNPCG